MSDRSKGLGKLTDLTFPKSLVLWHITSKDYSDFFLNSHGVPLQIYSSPEETQVHPFFMVIWGHWPWHGVINVSFKFQPVDCPSSHNMPQRLASQSFVYNSGTGNAPRPCYNYAPSKLMPLHKTMHSTEEDRCDPPAYSEADCPMYHSDYMLHAGLTHPRHTQGGHDPIGHTHVGHVANGHRAVQDTPPGLTLSGDRPAGYSGARHLPTGHAYAQNFIDNGQRTNTCTGMENNPTYNDHGCVYQEAPPSYESVVMEYSSWSDSDTQVFVKFMWISQFNQLSNTTRTLP